MEIKEYTKSHLATLPVHEIIKWIYNPISKDIDPDEVDEVAIWRIRGREILQQRIEFFMKYRQWFKYFQTTDQPVYISTFEYNDQLNRHYTLYCDNTRSQKSIDLIQYHRDNQWRIVFHENGLSDLEFYQMVIYNEKLIDFFHPFKEFQIDKNYIKAGKGIYPLRMIALLGINAIDKILQAEETNDLFERYIFKFDEKYDILHWETYFSSTSSKYLEDKYFDLLKLWNTLPDKV